ncbi:ion channel [Tsukamurella sp. 1534]|uniref:ion channel n=1 Tax=Tsukamurella sp. 1534 TaxID=1151061 RepID=UPI000302CA76|nr:ion channel [Tsukamurella sp. 1534]
MIGLTLMIKRFVSALTTGRRDPAFRGAVVSLLVIVFAATLFYTLTEHWSVLDSLYFAVSAGLPMGGSSVSPTMAISKVFTMIYALLVVGLFVTVGAGLANAVIKNNADRIAGRGKKSGDSGD